MLPWHKVRRQGGSRELRQTLPWSRGEQIAAATQLLDETTRPDGKRRIGLRCDRAAAPELKLPYPWRNDFSECNSVGCVRPSDVLSKIRPIRGSVVSRCTRLCPTAICSRFMLLALLLIVFLGCG